MAGVRAPWKRPPRFRALLPLLASKATCFFGFSDRSKLLMSSQQFLLVQELQSVSVAYHQITLADGRRKPTT